MAPPQRRRRAVSPPILGLIGPTAVGKTEFSLALAAELPIEILVADSRQVYRGLDVGTAKPLPSAQRLVRHHLLDLVEPDQPFTVADWLELARSLLPQVAARGALPLVVAGTGLYLAALVDGYSLDQQPWAPEVRERLGARLESEGLAALASRLAELDPTSAARTDLRNPRRVLRALERAEIVGAQAAASVRTDPYPGRVALLGLRRPLEVLDRRIGERVEDMFRRGLLDETRRLLEAGHAVSQPALTGHGYAEARRVLVGEWSQERAVAETARRVRRFARRQLRWFGRDRRIVWLDLGDTPANDPVLVRRGSDLLRLLVA